MVAETRLEQPGRPQRRVSPHCRGPEPDGPDFGRPPLSRHRAGRRRLAVPLRKRYSGFSHDSGLGGGRSIGSGFGVLPTGRRRLRTSISGGLIEGLLLQRIFSSVSKLAPASLRQAFTAAVPYAPFHADFTPRSHWFPPLRLASHRVEHEDLSAPGTSPRPCCRAGDAPSGRSASTYGSHWREGSAAV
jgi:hypothetical protein